MSAIDDEIGRFFDHMAGLSWDIEDYSKWMHDYEANRYKYPAWVTKDGRSIPVHELTDEHLANLIPFVYHNSSFASRGLASQSSGAD